MFTSRSACVSRNADSITSKDFLTFVSCHRGEVTIADLVIAVPENDISTGTAILSNLFDIAIEHGENFFIPGFQVKASVKGGLTRKRIFPVPIR